MGRLSQERPPQELDWSAPQPQISSPQKKSAVSASRLWVATVAEQAQQAQPWGPWWSGAEIQPAVRWFQGPSSPAAPPASLQGAPHSCTAGVS